MGGNREQVGSITRTWNADNASYSTNIYFNDANMDVRRKSLFLGAAFLLVSAGRRRRRRIVLTVRI